MKILCVCVCVYKIWLNKRKMSKLCVCVYIYIIQIDWQGFKVDFFFSNFWTAFIYHWNILYANKKRLIKNSMSNPCLSPLIRYTYNILRHSCMYIYIYIHKIDFLYTISYSIHKTIYLTAIHLCFTKRKMWNVVGEAHWNYWKD